MRSFVRQSSHAQSLDTWVHSTLHKSVVIRTHPRWLAYLLIDKMLQPDHIHISHSQIILALHDQVTMLSTGLI